MALTFIERLVAFLGLGEGGGKVSVGVGVVDMGVGKGASGVSIENWSGRNL